jgi:hypothetical protein
MCSALHRIIKRTGAAPEMLDVTVTTFVVPSMVTFLKPDYVPDRVTIAPAVRDVVFPSRSPSRRVHGDVFADPADGR